MKHLLLLVALSIMLLAGCKTQIPYIQLYETESTNAKKTKDCYTYENDTIRVDYVFWADGGVIAFRVLNKTNKPIYVDWFKSSYISNSQRYQYWTDKTKTEVNFEAVSRRNTIDFPAIIGYSGSAVATRTKPERISFIPPKSYIQKIGYYLTQSHFTNWETDFTKKTEPRKDQPKIMTTIYSKQFSKETSPLVFRNFLTASFKEDFSSEFYVDNEFYVKSVTDIERNQFWDDLPNPDNRTYDYRDFKNPYYSTTHFKNPTDFYFKTY